MVVRGLVVGLPFLFVAPHLAAQPPEPTRTPLVRVVDLALMESTQVELCNGEKVSVKLLEVKETSDPVREAVRSARVKIEVDGQAIWLESANYELPRTVGNVRVDCPIVRGYLRNSHRDPWQLKQDARLRLWPAGSPLVAPGTFVYPVKQRFFASATQMANEPCYVNACDRPSVRKIYYHNGLDFGGCEAMTEVVSATDGLVVSRGVEQLPGYEETPVRPRHDVVYVLDSRGWYYRYSEVLKVTDSAGRVDYDFAIVHALDRDKPEPMPPTIHPVYEPTVGIRPGVEVTFKVRTFATTDGEEIWDFGDGSPTVTSKSDGNVNSHAADGYALVTHRYQTPGQYLVRVLRTDRLGRRAVGYLHVPVSEASPVP